MGKSESWLDKVLAGDAGVLLEDIPALLHAVDLKTVDVGKFCIDRELARSYETIAAKAMQARSLFDQDAE